MSKKKLKHGGLHQAALLVVCFLAVCTAEDLMINEESLEFEQPLNDLAASKNLDLVFLIHTSNNVNKQKHTYYKQFMRDLVQNADIDSGNVRVGVVAYKKKGIVVFNLKKYKTKTSLLDAIDKLKIYRAKEGNVADGLDMVRTKVLFDKDARMEDAPKVVVIITDADSKGDLKKIQSSAQELKNKGAKIYAVGIGLKDMFQLQRVASLPTDVFNPATFANPGEITDEIIKQIPALQQRDQPEDDRTRTVDNSNKADLVIVFHLSNDIKPVEITKFFVPFLTSIIENARIDQGDVRIALVSYANKANTLFGLDKFSKAEQITKEIRKINRGYRAKKSSGGEALNEVRTNIFTTIGGDRHDAPNAVILITDDKNSEDQAQYLQEAETLKAAGVKIITVGIGSANAPELRIVASDPAEKNFISAQDYTLIAGLDIVQPIRNTILALQEAGVPVAAVTKETPTEAPRASVDLRREERADIVFAVHFGANRNRQDFDTLKDFIQSLIDTADVDGGRVRFSFYIDGRGKIFDFNRHITHEAVNTAVSRLNKSNFRAQKFDLVRTLRDARNEIFQSQGGDRDDVGDALIVITDTNSGQDSKEINKEKIQLAQKGVQLYTFGIGLSDKGEMETVASNSNNVFSFSDYDELQRYGASVRREIRALNTRRATQTSIRKPEVSFAKAQTMRGCAGARIDLVFVLDASTSVTEPNYLLMKNFVKDFLSEADIDSGNVRVGVIIYSTEDYVQFHLNTHRTKADVLKAIDTIPYRHGSTNTADALKTMRTEMFTQGNGDRPNVDNIAIVVTDGVSNINSRRTIPEAEQARADGIHIYAIGIGLTETRELDGIASKPVDENRFAVQDFSELTELRHKVFSALCTGSSPAPVVTEPPLPIPKVIASCADARIDLVFVLDASTSVTEPNYLLMKNFVKDFLSEADIDSGNVRVGVVIYSTEDYVQFHLNTHRTKADVLNAIDTIPYRHGSTNTADALKTMRTEMFTQGNGDRPNVDNIAIVVTDGVSNINSRRTIPEAEQARADGIHIYAIGIGLTETRELDGIASKPVDENRFAVQDFTELTELRHKVFSALCTGSSPAPLITEPPPHVPKVIASCADARIDLVFVLDASTSVTEPNYLLMKNFVKDFLSEADIDSGNVRVGVVIYSTEDYVQFHLNTHRTKADVLNAIDTIPYRHGSTNTADALNTMRTEMFTQGNGDRPNVDNIAIVVTDGVSNINSRRTVPEAEQARADGIHIYAIGIGLTETRELDGIASKPVDENRFAVQDFTELTDLRHKVFSALCTGSSPAPVVTEPPPSVKVIASCADARIDLVFVLDASTSVTEPNYLLMKNFVKDFLSEADIDSGNVRVGVVIYSTEDYVQFHLNTHRTKADVLNAIDTIPYRHGSTNTADALNTMRTEMFTQGNGDRPNVDNIAIVVTDGVSNINSRRTVPEAEQARADGIHIYAIGIGLTETRELDGIASKPVDENRFAVQDFTELTGLRHKVFSALCTGSSPAPVVTEPPPPIKVIASCADARIDLVFVLDASTSVTEPNYLLMKNFVKDFLSEADIDSGNVRVGVVIYSTEDYVQFHLNTHRTKADVLNAIDTIPYRHGSTNTADALNTMRTEMFTQGNGDRPNVDNIAIVVTDGVSNINSRRTIPEAEQARADGIHIYAIGIGLTETRELDGIASKPVDENRFAVQDFTELTDLRHKVFSALCTGSSPAPVVTEPPPPVKVIASCADARIDLVFVLDASTSVTEPNYLLMKNFVKDFLSEADIDSGNVRVGVVIYSTEDYVQFHLNTHRTKADVLNAIDTIPYRHGSTNTADALNTMRTEMFTQGNGDRPNVDNIAIVVTDGVSNINSRRTVPEAEQARADGIHIYAIGIGLTETRELDGIASKPVDENRFAVQDFTELTGLRHKVFSALCTGSSPAPVVTEPPPSVKVIASCADARIDLVFVLDASTSVTEPNYLLMKNFVKDFLSEADIDSGNVRVGVVIYSTEDYVQFHLNTHRTKADVLNAIDSIPYRHGSTNTADALNTMRTEMFTQGNGDRPNVDNIAIVVTDGVSNINSRRTIPEAEQARADGIHIYAIGIGLTETRELDGIASKPVDENRFAVQDFTELTGLRHKVFSALCTGSSPAPVVTEPTPRVPKVIASCADARIDLVFVLDASTSVTEPNYLLMKNFVKDFLSEADIDSGNVRVGVVIYSTEDYVQFHLNTHRTKADVLNAIDSIPYRHGSTNTADALNTMRTEMFTQGNGDRPNVDNIAIVVTDGVSNINSRRTIPEAEQARADGIHIYAIGIGLTETRELDGIASKPVDENRFAVQDFSELTELRHKVFSALCTGSSPAPGITKPPRTVGGGTTPEARITLPPPSDCALDRADIIIVIDSSTSVTEVNFKKVLAFVKDFLRKTDVDSGNVRVGILVYSTEVHQIFQLNTYNRLSTILRAVDNIPYIYGTTNTAGALNIMREVMFTPVNGDRADVPNYAVILTDGVSNMGADQTIPSARLAHDDGIHIYSIGVGLTDYRELDGLASPPARENSFKVADFDELQTVDDIIFASACPKVFTMPPPTRRPAVTTTERPTPPRRTPPTRPPVTTTQRTTTTTTPRTTTTTTRRTTTTTTRRPTTTTTRRPTTTTTRRPTTTTTRRTTTTTTRRPVTPRRTPVYSENGTDIVLMLDSSVDDRIFGWMKRFVIDFASQLAVDSGEWRVGGMTFDSRPRADFHLNRYNFRDEIVSSIDKMRTQRITGRPNVADAFDYVRRNMFVSSNGDRSKARNYVILLTGNEKSADSDQAYVAANRLKDLGTGIYTIGINFRDSTELDGISSEPADEYRTLVSSEDELGEVPGIYKYRIDRAPAPTPRPVVRITYPPVTRRPPRPIPDFTGDCRSKGDVIFVLDTSGSVGEYNFGLVKNFTYEVVKDLEIDNGFFRVGVITFSDSSRIEFQLNTHTTKEDIFNAIQRIPYVYGYTHTAEALRRVRREMFTTRNGDRLDVPNLLVVVTDGHSNVNHEETLPEARQIKSTGTTIVTVAIGLEDNVELRGLTSPPIEDNMIEVTDFESLNRLSQVIVSPLCSDTNICDRNPCRNEGVCVDGLRSYMCLCTVGFYGENCDKSCGPPADVVLILDSSTSVGSENFNAIKGYAQTMVSEMNVETCNIHIGVIKYSSAAMIQFNLGVHDTEDEIIRAIQAISYTPARANMAEAIRVVRTQMFNTRNGDRYNARNIAFLLTDGSAEINRDITASEAELTIDAGVRLVPLGVSLRDRTEIEYIAETQGMNLLEIESNTKFEMMSDQVLEAVYDPNNHCARNPCLNGAECVNAPLGFTCVCTEGFAGDLCDKACNTNADIAFVVDASRYNTGPDFRATKRFLRDVIKRMAFRGDNFRVAVVEYGASARLRLPLVEGDNKRTVKSVIGDLRRLSGDPNLESAVRLVDKNVFGAAGDRRDVPNYLVIVTRGVGSLAAVEAINELKSKGTKVIGIGVDLSATDRKYLEEAVTLPRDQTLFLQNTAADLDRISVDFTNFVCQEKNMCAENPCRNGGTCENGEKSYTCRCPPGYAGIDCSRTCEDRADVVFLIDSSGSVGFDNFRRVKEYIHHVIDSFNIGPDATRVGVATFSQSSRAEIYLNSYDNKRQLQAAVSGITYEYGNTNTASGIKLVRSSLFSEAKGNRPDVPDYLIIITDGLSNINHEATLPEAEYARKQGIHIIALGVGVGDPWELNGIASQPSDKNVFRIDNWERLWDVSDSVIDRTCKDTSVCDEDPCLNGGTCVAGIGTYSCQCQQGYVGQYCELDCQTNKDIAFILDASASVGPYNFEFVLKFVSSLVKNFTAYGQDHQFALITYSTDVRTVFSFNRYNSVDLILEAIQTTTYSAGSTNTAGGLREAIQLFQQEFGDRPSASNVAILITDGQSNVNYWDTGDAATALKSHNVKVIAVGINLDTFTEINSIASSPRDVYRVTSFKTLEDIGHDIIENSCAERE